MIRRGEELDPGGLPVGDRHQSERHDAGLRRGAAAAGAQSAARSSIWRRCCRSSAAAWCRPIRASKGGIAQLTKSLAIAYADDGIRVNAIAPGWIATPLTAALQADAGRSQPILDRTPLRRWGQPSDLLGGVLYLCSPAASFVTGTVLVIDGGYAIS